MELNEFARQLNSEVHDRVASGVDDGPFSEQVFTGLVLDYLAEIGMVEEPELCHIENRFKKAIVRLNGFAFSEEGDRLDLFVSVFRDQAEPSTVPKDELLDAAQQGARFFKAVVKGNYAAEVDPSHPAFSLAQTIVQRRKSILAVRVFVITDGIAKEKKFKSFEDDGINVTLEVMDIERLYRGMQAGLPRDELVVDFEELIGKLVPCIYVPATTSSIKYATCMAVIPGNVLYAIYEKYGARLLESNVRSFLSVNGRVNKGIRETLKTKADCFLAFNNGIVMTADQIVLDRAEDQTIGIRYLRGIQIVNGGQTTASIHRAKKVDKVDLSPVFVPAKIIMIPEKSQIEEMVASISRSANSQNTVQPADFSANAPFHIELEKLANTIWCPDQQGRWFYERARGSYQVALFREGDTPARLKKLKEVIPPQRRFSKTELAKYLHAWDQKPHLVSLGSQKNFDAFMQTLKKQYPSEWLPDESWYRDLIAKAILFREVQRQVQKLCREQELKAQPANISTYLVSFLALRTNGQFDLNRIWRYQDISQELRTLVVQWAVEIDRALRDSAKGKMVSEWAKKEACWDYIRGIDVPRSDRSVPEFAVKEAPVKMEA